MNYYKPIPCPKCKNECLIYDIKNFISKPCYLLRCTSCNHKFSIISDISLMNNWDNDFEENFMKTIKEEQDKQNEDSISS